MKDIKFNIEICNEKLGIPFYGDYLESREQVFIACDKAVKYFQSLLPSTDSVDIYIHRLDTKKHIYSGSVQIEFAGATTLYRMYTIIIDKIEEVLRG